MKAARKRPDRHPIWWAKVKEIEAEQNRNEGHARENKLYGMKWSYLYKLAYTPATTLKGAKAQVECLAEYFCQDSNWTHHPDLRMARLVVDTLARIIDSQK